MHVIYAQNLVSPRAAERGQRPTWLWGWDSRPSSTATVRCTRTSAAPSATAAVRPPRPAPTTAILCGVIPGITLVAPVLGKNALRVVDPALRGHPLLGVEAVPVERELGFVDRHPARKRVDKWLQRLLI